MGIPRIERDQNDFGHGRDYKPTDVDPWAFALRFISRALRARARSRAGRLGDALAAVLELYSEERRPPPSGIELPTSGQVVWTDALVEGLRRRGRRHRRGARATLLVKALAGGFDPVELALA